VADDDVIVADSFRAGDDEVKGRVLGFGAVGGLPGLLFTGLATGFVSTALFCFSSAFFDGFGTFFIFVF
jgi:hypothetical protein